MNDEPAHPSQEDAFRLLAAHSTMLLAYVLAIVRDMDLAEDTVSDVHLEIARCWDRYDAALPFGPWARGVARRIALANLRKVNRSPADLDEATLESLGSAIERLGDTEAFQAHKDTLRQCIDKLPPLQGQLVQMRYFDGQSTESIAAATGRSVDATHKLFQRLHGLLRECVRRRLGDG